MIDPVKQREGVSRATVVCDECGAEEVVGCSYEKNLKRHTTEPNAGVAREKVRRLGWTFVKGKDRCPTCEAKRKVVPMKVVEAEQPQAAREMTPKEKVQIYAMLAEVYDMDTGRYRNGDTDDAVAEVLGVMPGWVAQIREADFGPDGANDDIAGVTVALEESRAALTELRKALSSTEKDVDRIRADMDAERRRMDSALSKLGAIKSALSPRLLKKAGL